MTDTNKPAAVDRRFASTLARGLSVLRAFRVGEQGLTNLEISQRTKLPKSTVSRLTFTLQKLGYLSHSGRHDMYRPGPALLALGNIAMASVSFVELASDSMQELAEQAGALVVLAVRDEHKMLLLKTWRPTAASSLWLEVGHRISTPRSSSGQAMLAALSDADYAKFSDVFAADLGEGIGTLDDVRQQAYEQLVSQGFVIAPQHMHYSGTINAVSVPYRSGDSDDPVSFSCGAPSEDMSTERLIAEVGPQLRDRVRQLQRQTGQVSAYSPRD